jgi:hypothetical protein
MIDPAYLITGFMILFGWLGALKLTELAEEFHKRGMERIRNAK